tara:strand:+ start:4352 stop:4603 length:252 start_codon:yes stop_codon:yes gene_type:complete
MAGLQVGDLRLLASVLFVPPEKLIVLGAVNALSVWAGAAINVDEVYDSVAHDMAEVTFNFISRQSLCEQVSQSSHLCFSPLPW